MAARVLGVLSGAAAAGVISSIYWKKEIESLRLRSFEEMDELSKVIKLENQVIQEAAIREIEESHRTALSNAYEEVLQSPNPPTPEGMQEVFPFEELPPNPGIIRHVKDGNFIIGYDPYLHAPRWVIERITRESVTGTASRKGVRFFEDKNLPNSLRVSNASFGGYTRGHMASAGAHKEDKKALVSTFVMSNIVAQDGTNNASDWLRLELWSRELAKEYGQVIVLNAIGIPTIEKDTPSRTPTANNPNRPDTTRRRSRGYVSYSTVNNGKAWSAVPNLLLKAVCVPNLGDDGKACVAFFVTANKPNPSKDKRIITFQCTREDFERASGIHNAFVRAQAMPNYLITRCKDPPTFYQPIIGKPVVGSDDLDY
ncbi:hypothetical protein AAMO2058_001679400 [Amorphochlora amoebiformis]|uniref:Endonuclease n=1 Tax=Amorphochlora amoebiformis TaxID=1561963 RepID=A0A7S0DG08_9EUKA|mmetsp:Transcript_26398/g.41803  ORF Transcript_26398/g.41803 Transcript_26398/m.41803 type:complete len:370 (+) Transcript_26398:12-1121(+)